jgi:hypothetical protein
LVDVGTEEVGRPQDLDMTSVRSGMVEKEERDSYVWRMIVEFEVVVDDGVVDVVGLDQVLECSCSFLRCFFDVDRLDRRQVEFKSRSIATRQEI